MKKILEGNLRDFMHDIIRFLHSVNDV
jgi:hypothetical protein